MKLFYKLFRQNPESRESVVIMTSILGIAVNLVLAGVKVVIGAMVSSIAVMSEGINNAADSASSLLTIVGTKLSQKKPTRKHPFGFGRIEYLTSLIIAILILITGAEFLSSSIKLILHPEELKVSYTTILIVAISAVAKLWLGTYTSATGRRVNSDALIAVGADCRSDSIISVVTILSALYFLIFHHSVDAWAGIITSMFILKAGGEVLWETISKLLGQSADKEFADQLYQEIRGTKGVLNAADMMLHNYGPDSYSGSVNIEVDHEMKIGEIYQIIHELQLRIMHEHGVTMVFGIYAVDRDHPEHRVLRKHITEFVRAQEHVTSFHAVYFPPEEKKIYCDLVVDYELKDWQKLQDDFKSAMAKDYPEYDVELVVETEYV